MTPPLRNDFLSYVKDVMERAIAMRKEDNFKGMTPNEAASYAMVCCALSVLLMAATHDTDLRKPYNQMIGILGKFMTVDEQFINPFPDADYIDPDSDPRKN